MLRNTLILPDDDPLAARLLDDAINALDVVLLLVFGADGTAEGIVPIADQLADKTELPGGGNLRRVVWVRATGPAVRAVLDPIFAGSFPRVAALNFHDTVKARIEEGGSLSPVALEMAFLKGHQVP